VDETPTVTLDELRQTRQQRVKAAKAKHKAALRGTERLLAALQGKRTRSLKSAA